MTEETTTPTRPYATYNITTDKIQLYLKEGERLPQDEYEEARKNKYQFWHGRKCFAAKWSTGAEDFALRYVDEILADDTPDDLESRVERYQGYAARAEDNAHEAATRQTNTDRQARQAEGTFENETEKAQYWNHRIAGAIRHAAVKDDPGVIVRRIIKLEKTIKKHKTYIARLNNQLEAGTIPAEKNETANGLIKLYERWIEHNQTLIDYETAYLEAVGGDPRERVKDVKVGDVVEYGSHRVRVKSVGKVNVILEAPPSQHWNKWGNKIRREDLGEIVGHDSDFAAEVEAGAKERRKANSPDDGIKKGSVIVWADWNDRYYKREWESTVISAGTKNLRVTVPDGAHWDYIRSVKDNIRISRKDAKVKDES